MTSLLKGLPAFLGALGGAAIVIVGRFWLLALFAIIVAASALTVLIGFRRFREQPVLARWLIESWNIGLTALLALGAAAFLAVTFILDADDILGWTRLDGEQRKDLVKYLMGAVTAFAALLVTQDLDDAKGPLWPSTMFRKAARRAFAGLKSTNHPHVDAAHFDRTECNEAVGWGFKARGVRAEILAQPMVKSRRPPSRTKPAGGGT